MKKIIKPCVVGLGYVGLPIFLKLCKSFTTCGYDLNKSRIKNLKKKRDVNLEFKKNDFVLKKKSFFTFTKKDIRDSNFFIVTVPTPITKNKKPNLKFIKIAIESIKNFLKKDDIVVLESTVYPGVTENFCGNILKNNKKKFILNKDFFLGYSPERINPGDKKHSLKKINKIVSYPTKKCLENFKLVYKNLGKKIIYTNSIKEAETAKVVENIQRDLNIALINEIFIFCNKNKIQFDKVMELASTKWNFLNFKPGLVGGHCLPVDPYYFAEAAKKTGQKTKVTLSGRYINNYMTKFVSSLILKTIDRKKLKKQRILLAGMTYKKDVPDFRNSLSIEIYNIVRKKYPNITAYDPYANSNTISGQKIKNKVQIRNYDLVFFLTEHSIFMKYKNKKSKKFIFIFGKNNK